MAPGPRRAHLQRAVPVLDHLQRQHELLAKLLLAPADEGLGRQRADRVVGRIEAAVVGLARPDRQHDRARHAELAFDAIERCAMLLPDLAPGRGQPRDARLLQVVRRHLHELRLRRAGRRAARQGEVGKLQVRLERARGRIEGRARDAGALGVRPQRGDELREGGIGRARRIRQQPDRQPKRREAACATAAPEQREQARADQWALFLCAACSLFLCAVCSALLEMRST